MNPQIYLVGGAVRDFLLQRESKDRDFVVVGSSEQWLLDQGFTRVGLSFPVFLHPVTGDEYALARREKKVAPGYSGFEMEFGADVTLVEDLSRRDLTINSMALDEARDLIIDPFNGMSDLAYGILRHTSDAFKEDPLRVIRLARFIARYGFKVAPETDELCRSMVLAGDLDHLVVDRIWAEVAKMLEEPFFVRGLKFLRELNSVRQIKKLDFLFKTYSELIEDTPQTDSCLRDTIMHADEKAYFFTSLRDMSLDELEAARVPSAMRRKLLMFKRADELFIDFTLVNVVKFFDSFRNDITNGAIRDIIHFMLVQKRFDGHDWQLAALKDAFAKLNDLNFTQLVKNVQPGDIKKLVFDTKIQTIAKLLKEHK